MSGKLLVTVLTFMLCVLLAEYARASYVQDDSTELVAQGTQLFRQHCSACHSVHREVVGPMLASITKKRNREWLTRFIRNSGEVIVSGDTYAKFLFESYNNQVMPTFPMLSDQEIEGILKYIERESLVQVDETPVHTLINERSDSSVLHGRTLFRDQCSSCHFIHYEGRYAPALGSVSRRLPKSWLVPFIQNSQEVIRGGDVYAQALLERFHDREMVPMTFLSDEDVADILNYIAFSSTTHVADVAPSDRVERGTEAGDKTDRAEVDIASPQPLTITTITLFAIILAALIVCVILALRMFRFIRKR